MHKYYSTKPPCATRHPRTRARARSRASRSTTRSTSRARNDLHIADCDEWWWWSGWVATHIHTHAHTRLMTISESACVCARMRIYWLIHRRASLWRSFVCFQFVLELEITDEWSVLSGWPKQVIIEHTKPTALAFSTGSAGNYTDTCTIFTTTWKHQPVFG